MNEPKDKSFVTFLSGLPIEWQSLRGIPYAEIKERLTARKDEELRAAKQFFTEAMPLNDGTLGRIKAAATDFGDSLKVLAWFDEQDAKSRTPISKYAELEADGHPVAKIMADLMLELNALLVEYYVRLNKVSLPPAPENFGNN